MIAGREIALGALSVPGASVWQSIDAASDAGFDSLGLRVFDDTADEPNPLVADVAFRRETIARLQHHGLAVLDVEVVRLNERTNTEACRTALECAAALGARAVLVVGWDDDETRAIESFRALCEAAAEFGLRPALEFMAFSAVRDLGQAQRIVDAACHPAGGVLIDALHLRRSGAEPADVEAFVASHCERVVYAQLCDAPLAGPPARKSGLAEAAADRLAPGEGELPLRCFIDALPAGVPLSIEAPIAALASLSPSARANYVMKATRRLLTGER